MEPLDVDEVRMALKELVLGLNNTSSHSSNEEIKNDLLQLEEKDENFHRYTLIKMIRSNIESTLGPLIDGELNQSVGEDHPNKMISQMDVAEAMDRVVESSAYTNLFNRFSSAIKDAGQDLKQNFDAELLPSLLVSSNHVDSSDIPASGRNYSQLKTLCGRGKKTEILYSACDSPIDDSSSSQDTTMFLTNDSLAEIATNLNKKNSLEIRQSALRSLLMNTSVLDLPHAVWPPIREELLDILINFNGSLWMQALKIIARGLNAASPCCAKEMFQMLVEILLAQFSKPKKSHDNDDKIIVLSEGYGEKLLRAFRLLAQYVQQLSQKPSEKNTPDSFKGLFMLLSENRSCSLNLTPFQCFSLVDPSAAWFTRAMHGNHTRHLMLQLIGENKLLLAHCVTQIMDHSSSSTNGEQKDKNNSIGNKSQPIREQIANHSLMTSIIMLSGIITSANGRGFFPLKVDSTNQKEVSLQEAVIGLLNILLSTRHGQPTTNSSHQSVATPPGVILECLKKLCHTEEAARACMCHSDIVDVLLKPLVHWLEEDKKVEMTSLTAILRSCEVIEAVTSTESGRRFVIFGSQGGGGDDDDDGYQAPIKTIISFISESLTFELKCQPKVKAMMMMIQGHLLQVVRFLSGTCDGVEVLSEHGVHFAIKIALAVVSHEIENLATPTPSSLDATGPDLFQATNEKESLMEWESTLHDSLISMLVTPRGLGMVQETGLLKECLVHMYNRCDRKLHINDPNEKINYWFVTSQISTTPGGMVALTDFVTLLVNCLWSTLETNSDMTPPSIDPHSTHPNSIPQSLPKPWSPCSVEKFSLKPFNSLSNILCSFRGVCKLVSEQTLPSRTSGSGGKFMPPQTVLGLIDRLVVVQSDFKIRSLYSYEQSHLCGLRLLNLLSCCLDTCLLLQSQYDVIRVLLVSQRENVTHENSKEIIIDSLSLMRNHILVRSYLIGGPNERLLPAKDLDNNYPKPMKLFCEYPVPECYLLKINRKYGADALLASPSAKNASSWTDFKKSVSETLLKNSTGIKDEVAMTMMEQSLEYWVARKGDSGGSDVANIPSSSAKRFAFSKVQLEGMNLTIRYGKHLKLWNLSGKEMTERIKMVVAKVTMSLRRKLRPDGKPNINSESNSSGFDWFLSGIFLVSNGNVNRSVRFLNRLSYIPLSASYWTQHMQSLTLAANQITTDNNLGVMLCSMNHNFEVIMRNELPQVYSAFKLSGLAPGQILHHWTRQCLLNYLDWPQVQQYLLTCICLGPDYPIYFCLALLRHLELDIKHQVKERNLTTFLREEPIRNFQLDQHMTFMQSLEEKYRPIIIESINSICQLKK